jgi:hypothetical protein
MKRKEWKKLDKLIEQGSKEDKDYKCEICGRRKMDGWQIHHHHWQGRKKTSLRWVNENIFVVCVLCHNRFEEDPQWSVAIAKDKRGTKWLKLIGKIKDKTNKKTFEENKELMFKSLEEVLKSYK